MPSPHLIAAPTPMTAPPGSGTATPAAKGAGPQGFIAMLTALMPSAKPAADTPQAVQPNVPDTPKPGDTVPPQTEQSPVATPETLPAPVVQAVVLGKPKSTATDGTDTIQPKARPDRKDKSPTADPEQLPIQTPDALPTPVVPPTGIGTRPPEAPADSPAPGAAATAQPIEARKTPAVSIETPEPVAAPALQMSIDPVTAQIAPPVLPAVSPLAAAKDPSSTGTTSPAEQVAPVLVSVLNTPAGATHMTLQLRPDGLGDVHIQVDRTPDSPTQIRIEAERPETLALLQRDTPQLQRALDQAGIPHEAVTVTLHAAPSVAAAPSTQDGGQTSTQFMGTGQSHQGFGEGRQRYAPNPHTEYAMASDSTPEEASSVRSGIDITA